ncbi:MAG TPA: RNA-binding S4 domain-containing protein [Ruminococcaceae bacterium]|nr:RNA-binding S4 domain-containing protein [Oscillospiraceae bacterium]HBJ10605.1 RNA-binding S4 domain-containing protein [Oscillospiraceae bacterium]
MEYKKISVKEDFIRLDSAMKLASLVSTGGHAKIVIQNGEVKVNGEVCTQRGKKLHSGDKVEFNSNGFVIE